MTNQQAVLESASQQIQPDELQPILEIKGITKTFPGVTALDDVSFNCYAGEVHALVGENGAGKSTLMKVICGAYRPDKGTLMLRGREVSFKHPSDALSAGISIIYQEFNLLSDRSIAQNIFLGREPMRGPFVDHGAMVQQTKELLDSLDVALNPNTLVGRLRVAQQQVVEIAKALSLNADIVLMDEPSAALSQHEVDSLLALVRRLKERGITVIYISHRLDEVFKIADRVTVLKDGHWITTRRVAEVTRHDLVSSMVGRELDVYYPPKAVPETIGNVILDIKHLYVSDFLKDINFQVRRGEIVGLAGLEGSGRTFLARALFGAEQRGYLLPANTIGKFLIRALFGTMQLLRLGFVGLLLNRRVWSSAQRVNTGEIILNGESVHFNNPREAISAGIGFISEDRKREGLALMLPIQSNMALPSLNRRQQFGWIFRKAERELVKELSQSLDLRARNEHVEAQFLSGGNQQKVVLAKWLATQAKLLIFDEPTRGIDVGAKAGIHQLMRQLAAQGVGILMISSELPEVIGMSDRILVMRQGTIAGEFAGEHITEAQIMRAATATTGPVEVVS